MSAVKNAFEKIGDGIKEVADGIKDVAEGALKTVGGVLTINPALIKAGANEFDNGCKECVNGVADTAGAAVGITPIGAALNSITDGAASRLASGVFDSLASTVNGGFTGVEEIIDGVVDGDPTEMVKGAFGVGQIALLALPGVGEADMALSLALNTGKDMLTDAVT
ncbi:MULTISPECIES: hypothetical protein [unclassified Cupriavidus]|uniref:hypothetical protein n=1 Tax=unclassified Cupriavidus TaxID=2640874 RepID=UPI000410F95E|nr:MULTISPECIES: hypothetical protein [unclassified Cupriavidus]MBP0633717.1 hypothetical protein [Cupriavidus sp. AcVe19-1a]MBP0640216.1 hypothetical protein [Cupriavidus sp. AcVe19-6a]